MKINKIFDFIAKSSSVQLYIKQAVCYRKTNWWKVEKLKSKEQHVQTCQSKQDKQQKGSSLCFYCQSWISHGFTEESWVKRLENNENGVKNLLYDVGGIRLK